MTVTRKKMPFENHSEFTYWHNNSFGSWEWSSLDYALVRLCGPYLTLDIVKMMVSIGANLYYIDDYILASACHNNQYDIIEYILNSGTNLPLNEVIAIMDEKKADETSRALIEPFKLVCKSVKRGFPYHND